ncbi:heat shock protein 70 family [Cadophora sp. MPI-SDFR-AT-0126]|nr:heat shock protein 70 family [Leotiomycetes sp. MPI-SDFR-AT-0126]
MTTVKITSRDRQRGQQPPTGKKPEDSKDGPQSKSVWYILLAILGILVAVCIALLLNLQKDHSDGKLVPSKPDDSSMAQEVDIKQKTNPYCGNAYEDEWDYGCVLAIEIGETYSKIGTSVNDSMEVSVIDGQPAVPNYVAYTDRGILVGQEAKDQAQINPKNTIFDVRSIIGRRFSTDPSLQRDIDSLPFEVVIQEDKPIIKVHTNGQDKFITPEEVQATVLKKFKVAANEYYGQEVRSTVVTVPAYFDENQRQATKDAGLIAGLNVIRLVNEPTAAAIAHNIDRRECTTYDCEEFIIVYDLGEKRLDITVSSIEMGVFEILAKAGDRFFGGQNFDDSLLHHVVGELQKSSDVRLENNLGAFEKLKEEVVKAEETLSANTSAVIELEGMSLTITPEQLQRLHKSIFDQSVTHLQTVLKEAKLQKGNISHVILTGNTTQVAKLQPFLEAFFNGTKVSSVVPSEQAVLRGAVMQAEIFMGDTGTDWVGAFDISVLSLGIETNGGLFKVVVPRNTMMPTRSVVNVTTVNDNQSKIVLNIFEGQRPFVANNKLFGTFNITDLPLRPAGELTIEITFDLDANGVLRAVARDLENGKKTVFESSIQPRLSYEDIDSIIVDAEKHAEEDDKKRAVMNENFLGGGRDEFGVVVVRQEGEMPRG